jgi:Tol biopolymer transport system component
MVGLGIGAAAAALVLAGFWWITTHPAIRYMTPARILKITYFPGDKSDPAFSPDGQMLAFSWSGDSATRDIHVMPVGGDKPRRITDDKLNDISPAWSPDGQQIAYLRLDRIGKASLMVVPSTGGSERVIRDVHLIDDFFRAIRPLLTWTPDGKGIVYASQDDSLERASLYLTDLEGKSQRKWIGSGETSTGAASPSFSPDGKMFAYTEVFGPYQARLYVGEVRPDLSLGTPAAVTGPIPALIVSPVWSPDAKRLWFMQSSSIFEWSKGRTPRTLYVSKGLEAMTVAWRSGESARVVTADGDRAQSDYAEIRRIPLAPGGLAAEGEAVPIALQTAQSCPGISPDGKHLVFHRPRNGTADIWIMDENGENARQVTDLGSKTMGYPRWSPDGKRIAFHAWVGDKPQIHILDVDRALNGASPAKRGDGVKQITDATLGFFSPGWSPDGKYIYANRAVGGARIFRIPSNGGTPEDLFEGVTAMITPDGRTILYGKLGRAGIFSRSLEGDVATNSEIKLVDDYKPPGADLMPFADGLYYIGWDGPAKPRVARFYNFKQRKSVDVAVLPGRVSDTPGLIVAPARRSLAFSVFPGSSKDFTLIEFQ